MIAGSLARRYARALFDIGTDSDSYEQLGNEVESLARIYAASRELAEALTNPIFPRTRRRAILEAILERVSVSVMTRNFALLLMDRERIPYLPTIASELRIMVDERAGRVRAQVASARPLSAEDTSRITAALEALAHKSVVVEISHDPDLLGGITAKIGDVVYDGSIRTQLELLRERFL